MVIWTKPAAVSYDWDLKTSIKRLRGKIGNLAAQPWRDADAFKVRFEYTTSGPDPNKVYINTDSEWTSAWFNVFAEHGKSMPRGHRCLTVQLAMDINKKTRLSGSQYHIWETNTLEDDIG